MNSNKKLFPIITGAVFLLFVIATVFIGKFPDIPRITEQFYTFVEEFTSLRGLPRGGNDLLTMLRVILVFAFLALGVLCMVSKNNVVKGIISVVIGVIIMVLNIDFIKFLAELMVDSLDAFRIKQTINILIIITKFSMSVLTYFVLAIMLFATNNGRGSFFKKFWYAPAVPVVLCIVLRILADILIMDVEMLFYFSNSINLFIWVVFAGMYAVVLAGYGYSLVTTDKHYNGNYRY